MIFKSATNVKQTLHIVKIFLHKIIKKSLLFIARDFLINRIKTYNLELSNLQRAEFSLLLVEQNQTIF